MKYKVTLDPMRREGDGPKIYEVEADNYLREGRTVTFVRGDRLVGTYEDVTQIEEVRDN